MSRRKQSHVAAVRGRDYAMPSDFCQVFHHHMTRLYTLSFLLTAEDHKAEQCWVAGLEDCVQCNRVFREWAQSWARHTVIKIAIRMMAPARNKNMTTLRGPISDNTLVAITGLQAFTRFVYVMSVLETYSDRECSAMLDCTVAEVVQARTQALQQLALAYNPHEQPCP